MRELRRVENYVQKVGSHHCLELFKTDIGGRASAEFIGKKILSESLDFNILSFFSEISLNLI